MFMWYQSIESIALMHDSCIGLNKAPNWRNSLIKYFMCIPWGICLIHKHVYVLNQMLFLCVFPFQIVQMFLWICMFAVTNVVLNMTQVNVNGSYHIYTFSVTNVLNIMSVYVNGFSCHFNSQKLVQCLGQLIKYIYICMYVCMYVCIICSEAGEWNGSFVKLFWSIHTGNTRYWLLYSSENWNGKRIRKWYLSRLLYHYHFYHLQYHHFHHVIDI